MAGFDGGYGEGVAGFEEVALDFHGIDGSWGDVLLHGECGDDAGGLADVQGVRLQAGSPVDHAALAEVFLGRKEAIERFGDEALERNSEGTHAALAEFVRDIALAVELGFEPFFAHGAVQVDGVVAERDGVAKLQRLAGHALDFRRTKRVQADDAAALARVGDDAEVDEHRAKRCELRLLLDPRIDLGAVRGRVVAFFVRHGPVGLADRCVDVVEKMQRLELHHAVHGETRGGIFDRGDGGMHVVVVVQMRARDDAVVGRTSAVRHAAITDEGGPVPRLGLQIDLLTSNERFGKAGVHFVGVAGRFFAHEQLGGHALRILFHHGGPGVGLHMAFRVDGIA